MANNIGYVNFTEDGNLEFVERIEAAFPFTGYDDAQQRYPQIAKSYLVSDYHSEPYRNNIVIKVKLL